MLINKWSIMPSVLLTLRQSGRQLKMRRCYEYVGINLDFALLYSNGQRDVEKVID